MKVFRKGFLWILIPVLLLAGFIAAVRYLQQPVEPELQHGPRYPYAPQPGPHPLKGYAPFAKWYPWDNDVAPELLPQITLAYGGILWREAEPERGNYDFAALEEKYHLDTLKNRHCRLILRVIADDPHSQEPVDIPQWLYEEMDGDGTWYESKYGRDFSPNYAHPAMVQAHKELIQALADYYGQDFIGYIQMGSIGQFGEWHTSYGGQMPDTDTQNSYISHYREAFPGKPLLFRRPFASCGQDFPGYYNDMLAAQESTQDWLDWIQLGDSQKQIPPNPEFWLHGPVGGEFSHGDPYSPLSPERMPETLRQIDASHMSFIGPCAPLEPDTPQQLENAVEITGHLGYDLALTDISYPSILQQQENDLNLCLENRGSAPLFSPLYVQVTAYGPQQELLSLHTVRLTELETLLPQTQKEFTVPLPLSGLEEGLECRIYVAFLDPWTGERFPISSQTSETGRFYAGTARYIPQYNRFSLLKEWAKAHSIF